MQKSAVLGGAGHSDREEISVVRKVGGQGGAVGGGFPHI